MDSTSPTQISSPEQRIRKAFGSVARRDENGDFGLVRESILHPYKLWWKCDAFGVFSADGPGSLVKVNGITRRKGRQKIVTFWSVNQKTTRESVEDLKTRVMVRKTWRSSQRGVEQNPSGDRKTVNN